MSSKKRKQVSSSSDSESESSSAKTESSGSSDSSSSPAPKKRTTRSSPKKKTSGKSKAPKKTKKGKKKKDPNAPKKALSAYMLYATEHRPTVKAENPGLSFGELSGKVAADWKALSETDREPYDKKAAEDKKRYEKEKKNYTPPSGSDSSEDEKPRKKRAKKDPNAPKRGKNGFMFFSDAKRAEVTKNHGLKGIHAASKLGEMWKEMSDKEKEPYQKKAIEDKARYERELAKYKKS